MNHHYINMATTTNPFNVLFADKDIQATERSLRAHRGVLTKITCYIDTAVNAAKLLPTDRAAQGKDGMESRRNGSRL